MARYISQHSGFKKTIKHAVSQLVNTPRGPEQKVTEQPIIAFFQQGGVTPWEAEAALANFKFKGLGEGENPLHRVSYFDTTEQANRHGWTPEFQAEVEALLDAGQGQAYFRCDKPRLAAPWPSYDAFTDAKKISDFAATAGIDLEYVAAYERENQGRDSVLKALGAESVEGPSGDVVVTA